MQLPFFFFLNTLHYQTIIIIIAKLLLITKLSLIPQLIVGTELRKKELPKAALSTVTIKFTLL